MKNRTTDNLARRAIDLARLLEQIAAMHEQLRALTGRKLAAIRAADLDAMCSCNDEQEALVKRLREREGLRRQLMDAIGSDLGMAGKSGRTLTISQLLPKLPTGPRDTVNLARNRLQGVIAEVAQANRVNGAVVRELIHHLNVVFSAVRPSATKAGQYSASGSIGPAAPGVFETIG